MKYRAIASRAIFNPSHISNSLPLRRIVLYVCRPLNGKHKINILCALCGSAVKKAFNFNKKCLNPSCCISNLTFSPEAHTSTGSSAASGGWPWTTRRWSRFPWDPINFPLELPKAAARPPLKWLTTWPAGSGAAPLWCRFAPSIYRHARILGPGRHAIWPWKNNLTCEVQIKSTEYLNFRHFRHFEF